MTDFEKLVTALLNGESVTITPNTDFERYLIACIEGSGTEGLPTPNSRMDVLLYQLAEKIGNGDIGVAPADGTQTYILRTPAGEEVAAVLVEEATVFTATANDIREGTVAATESGVTTGTKVIPSYNTSEGYVLIPSGKEFKITALQALDKYDFTKLQVIICPYAGSVKGSVSAEKVVIDEKVYPVNSTDSLATVVRDSATKSINMGISNDSSSLYLLRYITFKEIY